MERVEVDQLTDLTIMISYEDIRNFRNNLTTFKIPRIKRVAQSKSLIETPGLERSSITPYKAAEDHGDKQHLSEVSNHQ